MNIPIFDRYESKWLSKSLDIDPVYTEYKELSDKLNFTTSGLTPILKIEIKGNEQNRFWFGFLGDEIVFKTIIKNGPKNAIKTQNILKESENSYNLLGREIDSLKFERNRIFFKNVKEYYGVVKKFGYHKLDSTNVIYGPIPLNFPKGDTLNVYWSEIPVKKYNNILQQVINIEHAKNLANSPLRYGLIPYYFPSIFVSDGF